MLGVGWQERKTDESIRESVHRKKTVVDIIRHRKLLFFDHICRMPDDWWWVKKVLLGSVDGVS